LDRPQSLSWPSQRGGSQREASVEEKFGMRGKKWVTEKPAYYHSFSEVHRCCATEYMGLYVRYPTYGRMTDVVAFQSRRAPRLLIDPQQRFVLTCTRTGRAVENFFRIAGTDSHPNFLMLVPSGEGTTWGAGEWGCLGSIRALGPLSWRWWRS